MYYSANGVDAQVEPWLPEFGYAVDVGANDGQFMSNSLTFEEKGWFVLCVEPNPLLEAAGRKRRKLWRAVACGEVDEEAKEFASVDEYPFYASSGFHAHEIPQHIHVPKKVQTMPVKVRTLNRLLEECGFPRLDYLTIDVEAHELSVLKGIDLMVWKPLVIVAESWSVETPITNYLREWGYELEGRYLEDNVYRLKPTLAVKPVAV